MFDALYGGQRHVREIGKRPLLPVSELAFPSHKESDQLPRRRSWFIREWAVHLDDGIENLIEGHDGSPFLDTRSAPCASERRSKNPSIHCRLGDNPPDLIEADLAAPVIIELRRARGCVVRHGGGRGPIVGPSRV